MRALIVINQKTKTMIAMILINKTVNISVGNRSSLTGAKTIGCGCNVLHHLTDMLISGISKNDMTPINEAIFEYLPSPNGSKE